MMPVPDANRGSQTGAMNSIPVAPETYKSMTSEKTNLQILQPSRKRLQPGDIFVLRPDSLPYLFGRVIRTDAIVAGFPGVLIYIYKTPSLDPQRVPILRRNELLIPPLITNRLPWSRGYFQTIQRGLLSRWDVLQVHCFRNPLTGKYYDESGRLLAMPVGPIGDYGLHSFRTIDDAVSDAVGIPRVPE